MNVSRAVIRPLIGIALVGALSSACSSDSKSTSTDAVTTTVGGQPVTPPKLAVLKGKAYQYQVGDFTIRLTFEDEYQVHWLYVATPDGTTGKNAVQTITRAAISDSVQLFAWKEADGTNVIDVIDLANMKLFVNFVTADGTYHSANPTFTEV